MTICTVDQVLPVATIEYSTPESPSEIPKYLPAPEIQSGFALYHDEGSTGRRDGWYILNPKETINIVRNPTFFNNLFSWIGFNSKIMRTNEWSFSDGFSMRLSGSGDVITSERREYAETEIIDFIPGQNYVLSAYMWTSQIWDNQDPFLLTLSIVDYNGVTFQEVFSSKLSEANKWFRLGITKTIRNDATQVFIRINLRSQDQRELAPPHNLTGFFNLANEMLFVDMVQFELGIVPTTPFHGDYETCATERENCEPYKWLDVPHKSPSRRSGCTRDGGELISLSSQGFEILEHNGHGAPEVRDVSFSYANRSGSEYQQTVVNDNILTFTGYFCETTLVDLEKQIFNLKQKLMPEPSRMRGKFLLIYLHQNCVNLECDSDRFIAYCVTYIGGFEGARNNLNQQRVTFQFKVHTPFPFEWPGHSAKSLSFLDVVDTNGIIKINVDGITRGFPLSPNLDLRTISCMPGTNHFIVGGLFDQINEDECSKNIALFDCDEFCNIGGGLVGGAVNTSITDLQGNVIVGGAFQGYLAIFYASTNGMGIFPDYPGDEVISLAAPFWAEVVVGTSTAIHIGRKEDDITTWISFTTNGEVRDFVVDDLGNIIAIGDFTTINGSIFNRIAKYNVNKTACLDIDNAEWEGLGFGFDGAMHSIDINKQTGTLYVGGEALNVVPTAVDICELHNGSKSDSKGSNEIHFSNLGGGIFRIELHLVNSVTQAFANYCNTTAPARRFIRVTGSSSAGTAYNFLFGDFNIIATALGTVGSLFTYSMDIDTTAVLGDPCASLDTALIEELIQSVNNLIIFEGLQLPGGLGIDNNVRTISAQCVQIEESFQGDNILINRIVCIENQNIIPLGNGLPTDVNKVFVHPLTGQLYAGVEVNTNLFTDGFVLWSGKEWCSFPANLGGVGENSVLDIVFCQSDCSLLILFEADGVSSIFGQSLINYLGSVEKIDFNLIIHGPAKLEHFEHTIDHRYIKFCTTLECDEVGDLNMGFGDFHSNFRANLAQTIVSGSRLDLILNKCNNPITLYITEDEATTKATLIWRTSHWGIDALCARERDTIVNELPFVIKCCNTTGLNKGRNPTDEDNAEQGWFAGDPWVNQLECNGRIFINVGNAIGAINPCDEHIKYSSDTGEVLQDDNEDIICGDLQEC